MLNRRQFLHRAGTLGAVTLGGLAGLQTTVRAADPASIAEAFDHEMEEFMKARNIPGGSLAVVKDLRLVYARGYGWADRDAKEAVRPESLFRIASISKPFTATAVLKLADAGKIDLDAKAFDLLPLKPVLKDGQQMDERLKKITVRHLLHHTAGWDRDQSGDPMFMPGKIARAAGVPAPAKQEAIIRYMMGQPLDFDPGARYAYSNLGYCILGRIMEKVTGLSYEEYMQREILKPIGITRMRQGITVESGRAPGEVKYYMPNDGKERSVFPEEKESVSPPYGGFYLEAMDSHGAWIASAVDLARYAAALDDPKRTEWISAKVRHDMYEPPAAPASRKPDGSLANVFYACGWDVRPVGKRGKANYWHNGSLPGTATMLTRRADGVSFAVLFNQRSTNSKLSDNGIDAGMNRAIEAVTEWPKEDLFPKFV